MAEEELELDVTQKKGSKTTVILLVVLILLVLIFGGVAAWLLLGNDDSSSSSDDADKPLLPLSYLTLVPEFIINFGPASKVRYLQVDLQIASRDEDALKTVNTYRPVLRNDILVLLSGQTFNDLKDRPGKEALQKKLLNTINKVVLSAGKTSEPAEDSDKQNTTEDAGAEAKQGPIENVYFTSFIMQ